MLFLMLAKLRISTVNHSTPPEDLLITLHTQIYYI